MEIEEFASMLENGTADQAPELETDADETDLDEERPGDNLDDEDEDDDAPKGEVEHDPDYIDPYEYAGREYTSLSALKRAFENAQDYISKTPKEERTPDALEQPQQALPIGVDPANWDRVVAAFSEDPGKTAQYCLSNPDFVGEAKTAEVYAAWQQHDPLAAQAFLFSAIVRAQQQEALEAQQPQRAELPEEVQTIVFERQAEDAENLLYEIIPGWNPDISEAVSQYMVANPDLFSPEDLATPQAMAAAIKTVYIQMVGEFHIAQALKEQAEVTPAPKSSKARKGSTTRGNAVPSSDDPDEDSPEAKLLAAAANLRNM